MLSLFRHYVLATPIARSPSCSMAPRRRIRLPDIGAAVRGAAARQYFGFARRPALVPCGNRLDFTDLVFIDPVSTGYSHMVANNDNMRRQLLVGRRRCRCARGGDPQMDREERPQGAVKFLVGESYGGFRVPRWRVLSQATRASAYAG